MSTASGTGEIAKAHRNSMTKRLVVKIVLHNAFSVCLVLSSGASSLAEDVLVIGLCVQATYLFLEALCEMGLSTMYPRLLLKLFKVFQR